MESHKDQSLERLFLTYNDSFSNLLSDQLHCIMFADDKTIIKTQTNQINNIFKLASRICNNWNQVV